MAALFWREPETFIKGSIILLLLSLPRAFLKHIEYNEKQQRTLVLKTSLEVIPLGLNQLFEAFYSSEKPFQSWEEKGKHVLK